ncbi:hypothetical protein [Nocardiopsis lambiniae]|uniref:MFS transporter n=1 Tax=Nocardiopsis lambiniae TaxID=3075539 RepID=A0ABU2MB10_9ACTN|nr:hypothetical protein [Nocardiopsis sp. DSM 44743]MDT0329867.1 hypothetical protein [Nocardiopsis sp. DSM 44743]
MSGAPSRLLPGHLMPLAVQWFAQDHPRSYGAIIGTVTGLVTVLLTVPISTEDRFGLPDAVPWLVGALCAVSSVVIGVWSTESDVRRATFDGDRERFREAQRLVRLGRLGGDAEVDRAAARYARSVMDAPVGHPWQGVLCGFAVPLFTLLGVARIGEGSFGFATTYLTSAAVCASYLVVAFPLIAHRRRRARALLFLFSSSP